jgi:hypothetical protein
MRVSEVASERAPLSLGGGRRALVAALRSELTVARGLRSTGFVESVEPTAVD